MKHSIAILILSLAPAWCVAQDKMNEAFRKGIAEEEAGRNPSGAIEHYQAVLAQYEEARKTAATALFRMAESYRKQGKIAEAQAAYGRLVREFADQAQLVAASRKYLPPAASSQTEGDARQRAVLEQQLQMARHNYDIAEEQYKLGGIGANDMVPAKMKLADAELSLAEAVGASHAVRLALRQQKVALLKADLDYRKKQFDLGVTDSSNVYQARLALEQAESELLNFEGKRTPGKK
jgi:hypothetical protein